ncbi:two-component system histidine kinase PnpS [Lederbergia wuyishanensis]|uniref:histidine kinase n=1 Tax=Lederbergia wuyishanensis TaxID=1347903 RepID=A0ABU0D8K6_9BACI|nr:ATP-binding protein [Lederbergia wuyishanensis]MCJ8007668.1 cell wall metabolism sensor histidine kinase WalK [Lederbergia wuyishanensis]MDQ0344748.1 two-component system phosphate regulon sensor histidine kinase PhoR [Lederbergia wuyishanensis]
MHKLWVRITFSFLLLMSLLLLVSGFFLAEMMKNTYYELKEKQLGQTAHLVLNAVEMDKTGLQAEDLQNKVMTLSSSIQSRLTIIAKNGVVLADTKDNPAEMENHANRPEVKQVLKEHLKSGLSIRYSDTLGYSMMYVTIPIIENDKTAGVMRVSLSMQNIEHAIRNLWISLALVLFAAFLLTGLIGMRLAKGISGPIEEMISVSEKLKEKDYTARVKMKSKGELGQLANAINVLASSLKNQMDKLHENEQRLTGVLTNMMSGVLLVNIEGRILLANRAMGQMLGEDPSTFTNKHHTEVGRSKELSNLIDQCLKTGNEIRNEVHFYYPKEKIVDAHLAPYVRENGEVNGIIAVLHDVTDIRRLEKMRSDFVANVSHELKTPITSLKGFAETLLDGAMEDEELCRNFLTIIYKESDRLHRLIKDILYLSSIEHHGIPLTIENVNVTEAVLSTAQTIKEGAVKKNLHLILPEKKDIWIEGEKDRIQQIALNLLSNAIAYTPDGGEISVSIEEQDKEVNLIISDTGIGIAQKELPRIFERFYRVEKARSRSSGGTGLGLAIVKHLVDSHNGKIDVKSVEGVGTTFIVSLPKKQYNEI